MNQPTTTTTTTTHTTRAALLLLGAALSACARNDARDAAEQQFSSAHLSLTFTRVGAGDALRFDAQGHFVRFSSSDADHVAAILGLADDDGQPLETCRLVDSAAALDRALVAARDTLPVRLLDAGRLQVKGTTDTTVLSPRHYPELTPYVTGIVYGNEDPLPLALEPGAAYEVSGEGGEDIGPFAAQVAAPRAFPGLEPAAYRRGGDLEVRWIADAEASAPLTLTLSWSARGTSREVVCRVRDDGAFTIARDYLSSMPAPGLLLSAEVAAVRTRVAAVSAPGAGHGELRIGLREVMPLPVSPLTAAAGTTLPATALDER